MGVRVYVSARQYLKAAIRASIETQYPAMVFVLARTADGEHLQSELYEYWSSLYDLTADQILIVVAGDASVENASHDADFVGEGLEIKSLYGDKWRENFLSGMSGSQVKPPETKESFETAITTATSDAAHYFGISEKYLPCIVILSTYDRKGVVISVADADPSFKIYAYLRKLIIDYEPFEGKIRQQRQVISDLEKVIQEVRHNVEREADVIKNYAEEWDIQRQSVLKCLDEVAGADHYKVLVEPIREWLNSSEESSWDYETAINELLEKVKEEEIELREKVEKGKGLFSPHYPRLKKKLKRAAARRASLRSQVFSKPVEARIKDLELRMRAENLRLRQLGDEPSIFNAAKSVATASGFCEENRGQGETKMSCLDWNLSFMVWKQPPNKQTRDSMEKEARSLASNEMKTKHT